MKVHEQLIEYIETGNRLTYYYNYIYNLTEFTTSKCACTAKVKDGGKEYIVKRTLTDLNGLGLDSFEMIKPEMVKSILIIWAKDNNIKLLGQSKSLFSVSHIK